MLLEYFGLWQIAKLVIPFKGLQKFIKIQNEGDKLTKCNRI